MIQMKGQDRTSEKEPKMEVSNLPDKEFKETPKKKNKKSDLKISSKRKASSCIQGNPFNGIS